MSLFGLPATVVAMCAAGIALGVLAAVVATPGIASARGSAKILALCNVCFAPPLAVFGALHLFGPQFVEGLVPGYMPWRMFWVYAVGCALIATAVSVATNLGVRWSGLLFGCMMFLFVALIHLPGALAQPTDRFAWTIVFREMSFGGAGWVLAGTARDGWSSRGKTVLTTFGRTWITIAVILFAIEHFLHPTGLPGVPLRREMPIWVPGRVMIDYVTGAGLLAAGAGMLLGRNTKTIIAGVGGWILLMVLVIYGPVLIGALGEPGIGANVEGINYFADTLLFSGTILALGRTVSHE